MRWHCRNGHKMTTRRFLTHFKRQKCAKRLKVQKLKKIHQKRFEVSFIKFAKRSLLSISSLFAQHYLNFQNRNFRSKTSDNGRTFFLIIYSVNTKYSRKAQEMRAKNLPFTLISLSFALSQISRSSSSNPKSLIFWRNAGQSVLGFVKRVCKSFLVGMCLFGNFFIDRVIRISVLSVFCLSNTRQDQPPQEYPSISSAVAYAIPGDRR